MDAHTKAVMFSTAAKTTSFQTGKDTWQTPRYLFTELDKEFQFTLDGAANADNHLCSRWLGPDSPLSEDALTASWRDEIVFCNPPYSLVSNFVKKAWDERHSSCCVLLIPSRTDTRWWHSHIWDNSTHTWRELVSGRFIKGRVKFIDPSGPLRKPTASVINGSHGANNSAPFPSVILVFGKPPLIPLNPANIPGDANRLRLRLAEARAQSQTHYLSYSHPQAKSRGKKPTECGRYVDKDRITGGGITATCPDCLRLLAEEL